MDKRTSYKDQSNATLQQSAMVVGDVSGGLTIYNNINPDPSPPVKIQYQLKPPVLSFEGREKHLKIIPDYFKDAAIVVLCGLGGTGKSELARKYADQHLKDYDSVIWLDAVTQETLASSIRSLYAIVIDNKKNDKKVDEKDDKGINNNYLMLDLISKRLKQQKVLLIIDDARDLSSIQDYLLICSAENVHTLITSNETIWNSDRLRRPIKCEEINNFTEDEAYTFIKSTLQLSDDSQQQDVQDLAQTMNYLPLALQQATAYIKQFSINREKIGETYTISQYLTQFKNDINLIRKDYTNDTNTKTVYTTFETTLKKLEENKDSFTAVNIINMMAYMSPNNIEIILFDYYKSDKDEIINAISVLNSYSIVKPVSAKNNALNMHGLVQLVRRQQLNMLHREVPVLRELLSLLHRINQRGLMLNHIGKHIVSAWDYAYKHNELVKQFFHPNKDNVVLFKYLLDGKKKHISESIFNVIKIKNSKPDIICINNVNLKVIKIIEKTIHRRYRYNLMAIAANQNDWESVRYLIAKRFAKNKLVLKIEKLYSFVTNESNGDYNYVFCQACQDGILDLVIMLLNFKNITLYIINQGMNTAAQFNHIDVLKYLVDDKHADVAATDWRGLTPLHYAAIRGHIDVVKYLVDDKHADVNAAHWCELTPLHCAAVRGHIDVVKYLVDDKHADVNAAHWCELTPLHYAAVRGHIDVVKYLVDDKHADVNAAHWCELTPLHCAAEGGHIDVVKYLVDDKHADVNAAHWRGLTPLHYAAEGGHIDVVKYLVDDKLADATATDSNGRTPLHCAAGGGHIDVVKYLVDDIHADVSATGSQGQTPLHSAAIRVHIDVVKYLVGNRPADVSATDSYGQTPLHSAAIRGHIDVVKYLVDDKHADVNPTDSDGRTPLHRATEGGHINVVKYLVDDKHADVNATDSHGRTPLHWAAEGGHIDVAKYLVDDKLADATATDSNGRTPLHCAAGGGHRDVVKYLVDDKHADVNATDSDGRTPLHCVNIAEVLSNAVGGLRNHLITTTNTER